MASREFPSKPAKDACQWGYPQCGQPATHDIWHRAQVIQVAAGSAGEESIALGHPADDAIIIGAGYRDAWISCACDAHADALLASVAALLDDVTARRRGDPHGARFWR